MKKLNILYIILGTTILVVIFIALSRKLPKTVHLTTFKKSYSYVNTYQDIEEMMVNIYINQKDSYLSETKKLNNAYISDDSNENQMQLRIKNIIKTNTKVSLNGDDYYLYQYIFNIIFLTENDFTLEINKAFLNLEYNQDNNIRLGVGSFSFYKVSNIGCSDISITRLKGIVNEVEGYKTLVAIEADFSNNTSSDIKITNVIPKDLNLSISKDDIKKLNSMDHRSNEDLNTLLGYSYQILNSSDSSEIQLQINKDDNNYYIFPLKYNTLFSVNKLGFLIEYEINGDKKIFYYDDFIFFSNYEFSQTEINNLIYYTYENN